MHSSHTTESRQILVDIAAVHHRHFYVVSAEPYRGLYLGVYSPPIFSAVVRLASCLYNLIIIKVHRPLKYKQYTFDIVLADSVPPIPFYGHPSLGILVRWSPLLSGWLGAFIQPPSRTMNSTHCSSHKQANNNHRNSRTNDDRIRNR